MAKLEVGFSLFDQIEWEMVESYGSGDASFADRMSLEIDGFNFSIVGEP